LGKDYFVLVGGARGGEFVSDCVDADVEPVFGVWVRDRAVWLIFIYWIFQVYIVSVCIYVNISPIRISIVI
jgi:hypothetical protein